MATTTKRGVSGKEKRGTSASPSPSSSINRRPSKPSTPTSSGDHERPTTPTDAKPIPNYLRPTISSIPKRSTTDSATLAQTMKPVLNRMRSFDKAPQSSQVQKAIRGSSTTHGMKPTRSSSFSNKTLTPSASSSSARPASSDRLYGRNALKGEKSEPQLAKPKDLRRSTLPSNIAKKYPKGVAPTSSTKKAPKSVVSEPCMDYTYETNSVDHHLGIEDHDMVNIDDHDLQSLPEISEMPESDQELGDPTNLEQQVEVKQEHHNLLEPIEEDHKRNGEVQEQESTPPPPSPPPKDDEHHNHDQEKSTDTNQIVEGPTEQEIIITQEKEPQLVEEERDQNQTIIEKHLDEEVNVEEDHSVDHQQPKVESAEEQIQVEQGAGDQAGLDLEVGPTEKLPEQQQQQPEQQVPKQEVVEKKGDEEKEKTEQETKTADLNEEKQQTVSIPPTSPIDSTSVSASTEEKRTEEKNEKPTPPPIVVKKPTTGGNKKENQQAYNDVIEETSKKLMGNTKKNKVLALAGAFETVISLQDTSPSKP